jgi:hypothetical protein
LDFDDVAMQLGVPMQNVCGSATVQGQWAQDQVDCSGQLDIDSAMVARTQLSRIRGPFHLDHQQVAVGTLTGNPAGGAAASPLISEFCGGRIEMDAQMELSGAHPFLLNAKFTECDIESISEEIVPKHKNLLGTGFDRLRLTGDASGKHSWRGQGELFLRNARIEVPIMSALGQVVREAELDRTIFDESNVAFEIRGENIDLNQIEMIGRPISLIGNGRVNHNREIDLDFYTILGRNRIKIPLVTDLYRAGSQQFLHIKVDGDLDNPQTHKTVLPGINEPLQRLARDLEARAATNANPQR